MALDQEQRGLLQHWQQLHFQDKTGEGLPTDRADTVRALLAQVEYAEAAKILSHEGASVLFNHYYDQYSAIVDSPEEQGGVNNYAEGALALLQGQKNESKSWKSSLSVETACTLPCIQNLKRVAQAAHASVIPPGKENEVLNIFQKDIVDTGKHKCQSETGSLPKVPVTSNGKRPLFTGPNQQSSQPSAANHRTSSTSAFGQPSNMAKSYASPDLHGKTESNRHSEEQSNFWNMSKKQNTCSAWQSVGSNSRDTDAGEMQRVGNQTRSRYNFSKRDPIRSGGDGSQDEDTDSDSPGGAFRTARQQLAIENQKKKNHGRGGGHVTTSSYGNAKKSLGTRRGPSGKFVPPVMNRDSGDSDEGVSLVRKAGPNKAPDGEEPVDERLKNIEPKMIELITNEIMDHGPPTSWDDIAGLEFAKKTIKEIVVWPMLRPDIFTGLRGPPKGLLLFGPPGTGKTLIGKCIASQSKSTFFSISASSLTSKWVGEGEKMVRALFAVARVNQPAVIFIDEIDSLLSQRTDGENEASRRIKTEFLVQLDGATTGSEDRILVVGATNRPQEIDEAARRRFVKRLHIPLPESVARRQIVVTLMSQQKHHLTEQELDFICGRSQGYSGADMANLCREAALGPIRSISFGEIEHITADQVRPIICDDFREAFNQVRASVSEKDLNLYSEWNSLYGSGGR